MIEYTKESLIAALNNITDMGWIKNRRSGNSGGAGNTLEDLLNIPENNLPLPNAAEWELKTHKKGSASLLTLFHAEPSPTAMKIVPQYLLPNYGWIHQQAGKKYPANEKSFRQTINYKGTARGFKIKIDSTNKRIIVAFSHQDVSAEFSEWLESVKTRTGLQDLNPVPYWGFDDLACKARTKLLNCFYVKVSVKREGKTEFYHYDEIYQCSSFSFKKFLNQIEAGNVYIDFDARTGHNHGTKFRYAESTAGLEELYDEVIKIR
ncbi:MAG: MvaI/BcnI family restriction endonuclease [Synergistes sp.]|nr:MvaI/BcnI family restriction endonuclease [Synergistes sp.]